MTLALLCQFTAQHVSDVSTSIFRSLRLLGALLCRLHCAVMTEVYVFIYLVVSVIPILCVVCGSEWVRSCKRVVSCGSWTFLCVVCFGVLCICIGVYMHELYIPDLLEVCWCYVAGLAVGDVVSECKLNYYWPVHCGPWGFRGLWPLGTRGFYRLGSAQEWAPEDGYINIRNMLSSKLTYWSKCHQFGLLLFKHQDDAQSNTHKVVK